jgi:hypothetical protein
MELNETEKTALTLFLYFRMCLSVLWFLCTCIFLCICAGFVLGICAVEPTPRCRTFGEINKILEISTVE